MFAVLMKNNYKNDKCKFFSQSINIIIQCNFVIEQLYFIKCR